MGDKCGRRALPTLMAQHCLWLWNIKILTRCPPGLFGDLLMHSRHFFSHLLTAYMGNWALSWSDQLPTKKLLRWLLKDGLAQTNYAWKDQGRRSVRHIISAQLDSVEACYLYLNRPYLFCSKIPITWKRRVLASENDYWIIKLAVIE